MNKVLIICGPSSSGKTSLALSVAKRLKNTSILSVDSRQVYKDIDIISGKDIPIDLPESIKFFGLDLYSPDESSNLSNFVEYARTTISDELSKGRQVIVVGGTGLYLKGITENLSSLGVVNNPDLRTMLESFSLVELQEKLSQLEPVRFNNLNNSDKNNPRRLIRQIEIAMSSTRKEITPVPVAQFHWIGLSISQDSLVEKIKSRVVNRLNNGAIKEVKKLLEINQDQHLPIFSTLGVREIISHLNGEISQDELVELWTRNELNYTKRQMVWFKKQPGIIWYDESVDRNNLSKDLSEYLTKND